MLDYKDKCCCPFPCPSVCSVSSSVAAFKVFFLITGLTMSPGVTVSTLSCLGPIKLLGSVDL